MPFTCPACGATSHHPKDEEHGYCGACHEFTGEDNVQEAYDDLQASFELRWQADMRAIKRWQQAHPGNDLTWPDHADLVVWLMEQLDHFKYSAQDMADAEQAAAERGFQANAMLTDAMREKIDNYERLDRVDTALARQLSESMQLNARLTNEITALRAAKP